MLSYRYSRTSIIARPYDSVSRVLWGLERLVPVECALRWACKR